MKFKQIEASESQECDAFCDIMRLYPKLWEALISIPNQSLCYTNPGVRKKLSQQGVKKGIPDYFLATPCQGFAGLWLEMKKKSEKGKDLRPEQEEWKYKLNSWGYKSVVVYGAEEAFRAVAEYIML